MIRLHLGLVSQRRAVSTITTMQTDQRFAQNEKLKKCPATPRMLLQGLGYQPDGTPLLRNEQPNGSIIPENSSYTSAFFQLKMAHLYICTPILNKIPLL